LTTVNIVKFAFVKLRVVDNVWCIF